MKYVAYISSFLMITLSLGPFYLFKNVLYPWDKSRILYLLHEGVELHFFLFMTIALFALPITSVFLSALLIIWSQRSNQ
jgi:hypothetical protein